MFVACRVRVCLEMAKWRTFTILVVLREEARSLTLTARLLMVVLKQMTHNGLSANVHEASLAVKGV